MHFISNTLFLEFYWSGDIINSNSFRTKTKKSNKMS